MPNIADILAPIMKVLEGLRTPAPVIPPPTILVGAPLRPGLSASLIAAKIIARQSEAGAPAGVLPSGNENIAELMEIIRIEEIINALLTDARIDVAIPIGIPVQAIGANSGGPLQALGTTTGIGTGTGIIR